MIRSMTRLGGALLALAALIFCAPSAEGQTTINDNINVDGSNRSYRLRIPAGADTGPKRPLILSLHGFTQNAGNQESQTAMNDVADTAGFYVAYPNGSTVLLFLQGWNDDLSDAGNNDIAFIDALIDELAANYNIDTNKVFATGFSAGGGMSVALACALPDRIKGIAPVAAAINPANAAFCAPSVFRPLLQIHGTNDAVVPFEGAPGTIFYPATAGALSFFRAWVSQDACSPPVFSNLPNTVPGDGSTVTLAELNSCASGQSYRFYRVNGGGHTVPGPGGDNQDLFSSAAIWDFFRSQGGAFGSLREADPNAGLLSASGGSIHSFASGEGSLQLQPNPAQSFTRFDAGTDGAWQARLIDASGRVVLATQGSGTQGQLDLSALPNGLYLLQVGERSQRLQVLR